MMSVKAAVDLITAALPGLGAGSPLYTAALNALRQLSRHLAGGAPAAGAQATMIKDLLNRTSQNAMLQKIMSQRAAAGQATNPDMPAGESPQMAEAPTPSMALPGA